MGSEPAPVMRFSDWLARYRPCSAVSADCAVIGQSKRQTAGNTRHTRHVLEIGALFLPGRSQSDQIRRAVAMRAPLSTDGDSVLRVVILQV